MAQWPPLLRTLLPECNTKLWMLQLRIRKGTVFLPIGFDFPQLLNKFCVVLF